MGVYVEKAYEIPECSRISKGRNIINFLNLQKGEKIASLISVDSFETEKSLVLCTRKGVTKKTKLSAYKNHRKGGIIELMLMKVMLFSIACLPLMMITFY